jgi:aryl-alcohol dehydrogenase-like predicted oxidoreductase
MEQRAFGSTGLTVSALGLGGGQVGQEHLSEGEASAMLNGVLDAGVTLIDTARGYGASEERIGRHLAARRTEFVLSSKGGYDIEGTEDWTGPNVRQGIDRALRLLRTDRIDIFHLHSCPQKMLERGDLLEALDEAVAAGKIGVAAYSGDGPDLASAVASGRFGSIETSVNVADQWSLRHVLPIRGALGVIAKRPIANAAWRFSAQPHGDYAEVYWQRLQALALDVGELEWDEFALRFSAYAPGVDTAIVGTSKPVNLARNVALVGRGPLPAEQLQAIDEAWVREGEAWTGQV